MSLLGIVRDREYHSNMHPPRSPREEGEEGAGREQEDPARAADVIANAQHHLHDEYAHAYFPAPDGDGDGDGSGRNGNDINGNDSSCSCDDASNSSAGTNGSRGSRRRRARSVRRRRVAVSEKGHRPGRPRHAALHELFHGTSLFVTCIFLPSFPRYVYHAYRWATAWTNAIRERIVWTIWLSWRFSLLVLERWGWIDDPYRDPAGNGEEGTTAAEDDTRGPPMRLGRIRRGIGRLLSSTTTASLWEEFNREQKRQQEEDVRAGDPSSRFTWGYGRTPSSFPALATVLQDVWVLVVLALLLAALRVWFVHMLVPEYLAPRRLEALTRCKSSHMLSSSSYQFGGVRGWEEARRRAGVRRVSRSGRYAADRPREEGGGGGGGWYGRTLAWATWQWYRLRPSIRRALGHEPSARYNDIVADQHQRSSSPYRRSDSNPDPARHLFSAPRHATAAFRLAYTSASCVAALVLFRSAEFWPRAVFGTHPRADTRNCWDLSGSFSALGFLDDDYDARNVSLKYFFLAQAAYQLHSLCFHLVSMVLLLLYGGSGDGTGGRLRRMWGSFSGGHFSLQRRRDGDPPAQGRQRPRSARLISMKTSMQSYLRPMTEHAIVLALLIGAYLFSGLRRLGAVGIFTLELSSVSLQLLQACVYAPEGSRWRRPEVVLFVHRALTIPTFVYCRLIILPLVLWRSALFESREWLEQIERVFSPGWAERLYAMFNGALCLIFVLNLVLFRRLLFHPHLKEIVNQRRTHR